MQNPGVLQVEEGSRITDVIQLAGGLTQDADISKINLVYVIEDGMKITIPSKVEKDVSEEDKTDEYVEKQKSNDDKKTSKININKATQEELETLPGIGPSIAQKIIGYRNTNGNFLNIEDLKKVSGIGESKYAQIKDYVSIK